MHIFRLFHLGGKQPQLCPKAIFPKCPGVLEMLRFSHSPFKHPWGNLVVLADTTKSYTTSEKHMNVKLCSGTSGEFLCPVQQTFILQKHSASFEPLNHFV